MSPANDVLQRLGQSLGRNKDDEWWLKLHEDRLVGLIRRFGTDSRAASAARADIATRLEILGRLEEARLLREEVVAGHQRNVGEDHPATLAAQEWLVRNLTSEQPELAREIALHVYEARRRTQGDDHEDTLRVKRVLEGLEYP
jgi:hypothetical protein